MDFSYNFDGDLYNYNTYGKYDNSDGSIKFNGSRNYGSSPITYEYNGIKYIQSGDDEEIYLYLSPNKKFDYRSESGSCVYFINGDIEFDTELVNRLKIDYEDRQKLTSLIIHKKPKD